ncbi:MAG: P1 family peptidase [Christensenellales bacterium]|jgi:L-aminopeptidase/D-esterase-like protein
MLEKFLIGHKNNDSTGVSVIIAPEGAVAGVSVRGCAPGTRETDLLRADATVDKINAVVLTGGSAFGLESSCGVMKYLREKGIGYNTGTQTVPIVCSAVLYDLDYKEFSYPDSEMGYEAAKAAKPDNTESGDIGAGTGATVGKIMGMMTAVKGGLGISRAKFENLEIMAIAAVNAFGDVYDYKSGEIIAGAKSEEGYINTSEMILQGMEIEPSAKNTTLGCILTNAILTKAEANKLCDRVHDALALTIRPVHTMVDGDTVFAMASGEVEANFIQLSEASVKLMAEAIMNSVTK